MQGRIVKGIAGFYYVRCGDRVYECRAKGVLRREGCRPLVGDFVELDVLDEAEGLGNVRELLPRDSQLIRPAVANVDQALILFSAVKPEPSFNLLDRLLVMMGQQGIACIVCFNKLDIDTEGKAEGYRRIYGACGYRTLAVSAAAGAGIDELRALLRHRTTALAGPSGVGKSSLVNCLQRSTVMETGEISRKIERGRHTTRHSELIAIGEDSYILDTPGFSSLGLSGLEKEQLAGYYPEFSAYGEACRFRGCSHVQERDCGVKAAVAEGAVSGLRYGNYCLLYEELGQAAHGNQRKGGRA